MIRSLPALIWNRPRNRVEWSFAIALGIMMLAGLIWLVTHGDVENREALSQWLKVLRGDTSLKLKTPDYVRGGLMFTALSWLVISLFLWLSRSWWWGAPGRAKSSTTTPLFDRRFAIGVGVILLLAVGIRWPRLDLGLYNDEIDVFRTSIEGSFDNKAFLDATNDELPKYRAVEWLETVWGNRIGNNHALHSILARTGYDLWHQFSGMPEGTIKEWPLRLPALFGGLLSIVAIAALAKLLTGHARAGWLAAFFLAVHPWHVRYSTEARGYGLVFGFSALTLLCLILAIKRGQWRWWLGFGASQAATLWSCIGALHLIVAINLIAGIAFLWPKKSSEGARLNPVKSPTLPCWIVACLLSASVYLFLASPTIPPLSLALKTNATFQHGVLPDWERNTLTYFLVGMPWTDADPENPLCVAMTKYLKNPLILIGFVVAGVLALSGIWQLCRRGGFAGRLSVAGPALGVFLLWLSSTLGGSTLLGWYANYGTVFVALWMGVGLHYWALSAKRQAEGKRSAENRLVTYGVLALYMFAIGQPLVTYRNHGKQQMREAIQFIRGGVYPFTEEQRKPLVAGWWTHANFYDPHLRIGHTPENLQILIDRALAEERPLFYVLGTRPLALAEDPRIIERLENSGDFELAAEFAGLEETQFHTLIFRFLGNENR